MTTCTIPTEGNELIGRLKQAVADSGINNNEFYKTFQSGRFPLPVVKQVFQQYYYYIRTFPQILAGLSSRVEDETIRMKLARTVVSELGDNGGLAHYLMFEQVLKSVGVTLDDYRTAKYIPEAIGLVDGLRDLFLVQSGYCALGADYVIEEFGLPMINALYEGFRQYPGWEVEDFGYFHLHMLIESDHVEWITDAIRAASKDYEKEKEIENGAVQVLILLNRFWGGLNRLAHVGITEECIAVSS